MGGLFLGLIPEICFFFRPEIIDMPDLDFVRANGMVERSDGEKFEVFYPPL